MAIEQRFLTQPDAALSLREKPVAPPLRALPPAEVLVEDLLSAPQVEQKGKPEEKKGVFMPRGSVAVFLRSDYEKEELLKRGIALNKAKDPHDMDTILEELRRKHA